MDPSQLPKQEYDVFLSHASANKRWAEVLAQNLKSTGRRVFYDEWSLVPGSELVSGLYDGLQHSRTGILVVSPEAANSGWVGREYRRMIHRRTKDPGFRFVPVVYGEMAEMPFLEDILWEDFRPRGDDPEADYRRGFHRLLCGLEGRCPGDQSFTEDLTIPGAECATPLDQGSGDFFAGLFSALEFTPVQLLLAQADRAGGPVIQTLLADARARYGATTCHHLAPPFDPEAGMDAYFTLLARQCGMDPAAGNAAAFEGALHQRFMDGKTLFLLVSGLENGSDEGRHRLAGMLRNLADMYPNQLRVVLCGGERLSDLKYADGTLSMFNTAEEHHWPELGVADLVEIQAERYGGNGLTTGEAEAVLSAAGGHPRLILWCLEQRRRQPEGEPPDYRRTLAASPFMHQQFTPFKRDPQALERLCALLAADDLGPAEPYLQDPLLRRLYWRNLCRPVGDRLRWRCAAIREGGKKVLGCL